jgi:hypothetical protein
MTATIQRPWGNDATDPANNAPNGGAYGYLTNMMGNEAANVQPTASGWEVEHASGMKETLVAIGGLKSNLVVAAVVDYSGVVGHSNSEHIGMLVRTNYGIQFPPTVNTANLWIVAISNDANIANVNLLYVPANSHPESGELFFQSAATDLSNATANTTKLTVNSTSALHGAASFVPRQPSVGAVALTGTPFPGANSSTGVTVTVH